jgi:hypothetical protein
MTALENRTLLRAPLRLLDQDAAPRASSPPTTVVFGDGIPATSGCANEPPHHCSSRTELMLAVRLLQPREVVVFAGAADEADLTRGLAATLRRLRMLSPHTRFVANVDAPSIDLAASLTAAGAVLAHEHGHGVASGAATTIDEWATWLRATWGIVARTHTERTLALLATGLDSADVVDALMRANQFRDRPPAVAYVRRFAKALSGDDFRDPAVVGIAATAALSGLAMVRPLQWRPGHLGIGITAAARLLRAQPSLVSAAGLAFAEASVLLAFDEELARKHSLEQGTVGAPRRDAPREARAFAAGHVAAQRGATKMTVNAAARALLTQASGAAAAIRTASAESFRWPQARLGAGLDALSRLRAPEFPDWIETVDGAATWEGVGAWQLADHHQHAIPPAVCRDLTARIDTLLSRHDALSAAIR